MAGVMGNFICQLFWVTIPNIWPITSKCCYNDTCRYNLGKQVRRADNPRESEWASPSQRTEEEDRLPCRKE